jgi:hypothetical protein
LLFAFWPEVYENYIALGFCFFGRSKSEALSQMDTIKDRTGHMGARTIASQFHVGDLLGRCPLLDKTRDIDTVIRVYFEGQHRENMNYSAETRLRWMLAVNWAICCLNDGFVNEKKKKRKPDREEGG